MTLLLRVNDECENDVVVDDRFLNKTEDQNERVYGRMHGSSRLRILFGWRLQISTKSTTTILILLLVLLSSSIPPKMQLFAMGNHAGKFPHSPESLLATVDEIVEFEYLNVFYGPCNLTMYRDTPYKKAWEHAQMNEYAKGAELFNHFVTVTRKGRDYTWRQAVCDGWPFSLFECRIHAEMNMPICQCLNIPKLTEFEVVEEDIFENKTFIAPVCRVKFGKKCIPKTKVLQCANEAECVSDVCRTVNLEPSLILVVIFAYFSFCRFH